MIATEADTDFLDPEVFKFGDPLLRIRNTKLETVGTFRSKDSLKLKLH